MSQRNHGPGLVGLLASLLVILLPVLGIAAILNLFIAPPARVTHITVVINGQTVLCTETLDPQTGARSRAC